MSARVVSGVSWWRQATKAAVVARRWLLADVRQCSREIRWRRLLAALIRDTDVTRVCAACGAGEDGSTAPAAMRRRRIGVRIAGRSLNMLVLSRQRDETIMIGDDIEVTVVDIRGDKVRLGINAPKEISVHRKEVYDAIRRENKAAAQVKPEDLSGLGKIGPKSQDKEERK
jgi:carbon storage regulator